MPYWINCGILAGVWPFSGTWILNGDSRTLPCMSARASRGLIFVDGEHDHQTLIGVKEERYLVRQAQNIGRARVQVLGLEKVVEMAENGV